MKYLLISKKNLDIKNFKKLDKRVSFKKEISETFIRKYKPDIIFFLHWSKKIHEKIYSNYLCIQFHCSDLPKFRGGSPLQHQILYGLKKTKLTAFQVNNGIDTGDICFKKNLSLSVNANTIYKLIDKISIYMINDIIKKKKIRFFKQKLKSKFYKRRKKEDSNLLKINKAKIDKIYNFIRMLDADDYPKAFINFDNYKIYFKNAKLVNNEINGTFKICKK